MALFVFHIFDVFTIIPKSEDLKKYELLTQT